MNYKSFKCRTLDFNKPVKVYRNLHNGMLSVKQGNLVICHVKNIILDNVSFSVSEKARQKVLSTKQKNVHAFITGNVKHINLDNASILSKYANISFSYNPYKYNYFYIKDDNSPVTIQESEQVLIDSELGCFVLSAIV